MKKIEFASLLSLIVIVVLAASGSGCPSISPMKTAELITVVSGTEDSAKTIPLYKDTKQGPVPVADIEAFYVTLNEITLIQEGAGEVTLFGDNPVDINLVELMGVSSILSAVEVYSGVYNQIRLDIEKPELYLVDEPNTPITDIQLTANNQLFIGDQFIIPENQASLLMLEFESMHLVERGNNQYVLTPNLQANVSVVDAEAQLEGEIIAIDPETEMLTIQLPDGEIDVHFAEAALYQSFDAYDEMDEDAIVDDLVPGASVWVEGLLQADGTVQADAIVLLN